MDALLIGYARVSTDEQDLTAQRDALAAHSHLSALREAGEIDEVIAGAHDVCSSGR